MEQIVTMRELLDTHFPDESLVSHGLLSKRSKLLLGGDAKTGKSYITLEMVGELACGRPFLQTFETKQALRVVLMQFEVNAAIVQQRYRRYVEVWRDERMLDNVFILNTKRFRIDEDECMGEMHDILAALHPDIVVFDPLYYMHSADENSTKEMAGIVRRLDAVTDEHNVAVVLVHHKRKPQMDSRGGRVRGGVADFRGSSVLWGWPDTLLDVTKRGQYQGVDIDFTIRNFEEPLSTLQLDWRQTGLPLAVVNESQPLVTTGIVIGIAKSLPSPFPQLELEKLLADRSSESTAKRTITRLKSEGVLEEDGTTGDKRRKMLRLVGRGEEDGGM